jgi:2'-hydroxyisoflavone reductase
MKLLLLGGTRFLGRHVARQALDAGHHVTLLHRGRSGAGLFPEARHLIADRDGDLADVLPAGATWDACIDTSAYRPRQVQHVAAALGARVGHYQLVSSISVYASLAEPGLREDAPLQQLAHPTVEVVDGSTYGGLKALCEQAALAAFGDGRCTIVRPGLIVGPFDPTGRYTWWVQRLRRGGAVLAPGDPAAPVQCIDARDLAAWMLHQAEAGTPGVFNATGPERPCTLGTLLADAATALRSDARLVWVDEAFLLERGVAPWTELPLWLPRAQSGLHTVDIGRALATGLRCRPLAETARDTAAWCDEAVAVPAPAEGPPRPGVGLDPAREAALLAEWAAR